MSHTPARFVAPSRRSLLPAVACALLAGLAACSGPRPAPAPDVPALEQELAAAARHVASDLPQPALAIYDRLIVTDDLPEALVIRAQLGRAECRLALGEPALAASDAQIAELRWKAARRRPGGTSLDSLAPEIDRVAGDCALFTSDPAGARRRYEHALAGRAKPPPGDDAALRFRVWLAAKRAFDPDAAALRAALPAETRPDLAAFAARLGVAADGSSAASVATPAPAGPPHAKAPELAGVDVRPRSAWSALPPDRSKLDPMTKVFRITVHHSGEVRDASAGTADAAIAIKNIQAAHQRGEGYADVGYHFLIDAAGRVWEGRELKYQGAHAGNSALNAGNVGVCLLGDFDRQPLPIAQAEALVAVLDALRKKHGVRLDRVYGHGEIRVKGGLGGTECPGDRVQAVVEKYRRGGFSASLGQGASNP